MVSLQSPTSPNGRKTTIPELDYLSKKRKWDDDEPAEIDGIFDKRSKPTEITNSFFEIELQLETPLPLEWQRCLDIQSGQIHFYNTRTQKRTTRDPRRSPEPPSPGSMSLDLELNLQPCESPWKNNTNSQSMNHNFASSIQSLGDLFMGSSKDNKKAEGLKRSPSWLSFEGDDGEEMIATVCSRCHMLVMLCKSSPTCPNCKFMHSPARTPLSYSSKGLASCASELNQ